MLVTLTQILASILPMAATYFGGLGVDFDYFSYYVEV